MKNLFKILFVGFIASFILSCEKDEDRAELGKVTNGAFTSNTTKLTLVKEDADKMAITFDWSNPDMGVSLAYSNQLEIALEGTDFKDAKVVDLVAGTKSISYTVQAFNALMLNAGLPVNTVSKVEARVKSTVSAFVDPAYSNTIKLEVTPYALISYLYAPGAYQDWNPSTANTLISATSNGIYEGYIDFLEANSKFKITLARTWDESYGTDDDISIILNGGRDINAPNAGSQKIVVNTNTNKFTLTPYSWGVIGSAQPGGWEADTDMFWDDTVKMFVVENVTLQSGEIKFRLNNDWGTNYGGANGNAISGGDNITISESGTYKIAFDLTNLKYFLTKK